MKRLTAAQRDHRNRRRGGKTRTEQLREKLHRKRRQLRENNQKEPTFHTTPITKHVENGRGNPNDYAVYGIYKDGPEWVLTGLSATDSYETTHNTGRSQRSRTEVRGRYLAHGNGALAPQDGVEIDRFDTKRAAMQKISADGSEKVDAGAYLVRPEHDPRAFHTERVDKDDWLAFINSARTLRVRE